MKYAEWKPLSTSLVRRSKKWRSINNNERVIWLHLNLISDAYGAIEGSTTTLWAIAGEPFGYTLAAFRRGMERLEEMGLIQQQITQDETCWTLITNYENMLTADMKRRRGKKLAPDYKKHQKPSVSEHKSELVRSSVGVSPALDIDRDIDRDIDNYVFTDVKTMSGKIPTADLRTQTNEVFDHWKHVEAATGGMTQPTLTTNRRAKIAARLADGYTVEQLKQCVEGFCYDPFHSGQNNRNTRYTDLTTIFRNAEKVDAGIQKYAQTKKQRNERARLEELYGKPDVVAEYDDHGNFI